MAPNAKIIDADEFNIFRKGSALIRKGQSYALIDKMGNIIVPFNKYKSISFSKDISEVGYYPSTTGIYEVSTPENYPAGYINQTGKMIYSIPPKSQILTVQTGKGDYGFAYFQLKAILKDGNVLMQDFHLNSDGLIITKDYKGLPIDELSPLTLTSMHKAHPDFVTASNYSEGLAAVGKKNEFGEVKWGYIDYKGNTVIPFKYSKQPGDFGCGFAAVVPAVVEDFRIAYINKRGEIGF